MNYFKLKFNNCLMPTGSGRVVAQIGMISSLCFTGGLIQSSQFCSVISLARYNLFVYLISILGNVKVKVNMML